LRRGVDRSCQNTQGLLKDDTFRVWAVPSGRTESDCGTPMSYVLSLH